VGRLSKKKQSTNEMTVFCTPYQSYNSITLISSEQKRVQILVAKWNKTKEGRIEQQ